MPLIHIPYSGQDAINLIKTGTLRVQAPLAADWLDANYESDEYVVTQTSGVLTGVINYLDTRFDDPRYYTGDTPD